jgi:phosphatidate cytidylyltransferase
MLASRLATSAAMIAALVGVLVFDQRFAPWFPLWFVTSAIVMARSSLEVVGLLRASGARASANTVVGGTLALVAANWLPHVMAVQASPALEAMGHDPAAAAQALAWPMWAFTAIVMASFLGRSAQFQAPGGAVASISGTVLTVAWVGVLGSFIIQMRWLDGPHDGLIPLALLIATAKGSDTGAYTIGRIFGRHKLWPQLSPKKTIEGAVGGVLFSILAALLVVWLCRLARISTFSWPAAVGYGLFVGLAAQLGDLMESMVKRDCARKDASAALPGFGGVLDVMDSLLFAGPVAYGYWLALGP